MQSVNLTEYTTNLSSGLNVVHHLNKDQRELLSEGEQNDSQSNNNNTQQHVDRFSQPQTLIVDETKQYMDGFIPDDDTDDELMKDNKSDFDSTQLQQLTGLKKTGKKTRGRVKIKMEFIQNKLRRYTTFSKRKTGIMKKAYELSTLTGTQVMLLVASETGHVYTFATRKLQPMITSESGKALIQTCLNSPDPTPQIITQGIVQQAQIATVNQTVQQSSPTHISLPTPPSDQRMSQTGYQEPDLQYANTEEDLRGSQSCTVQHNLSSATTFPVTYITQSTIQGHSVKSMPVAVQSGGITTIFSPTSSSTVINSTHQQPHILSGQLQLHRIHPQNIILTGNSPSLQPTNHIILNHSPGGSSSIMMADRTQVTSSEQHQSQDVLLVQNASDLSSGPLQMVYSPASGVIYAQQATLKRNHNNTDAVSMHHTRVIQTPLNQDDRGVDNSENIIIRHSQADMK